MVKENKMAETRNDAAARKRSLAIKYRDKISKNREKLEELMPKDQYDFCHHFSNVTDSPIYKELELTLRNGTSDLSKYVRKDMEWLLRVISEEKFNALLYYAERLTLYPYSESYMRRSLRSKDATVYLERFVSTVRHMNVFTVDESLADIINRRIPEEVAAYLEENSWQGPGYRPEQVAYAIDSGNEEVREAVRRILTEENYSSMMRDELIRGILMSDDKEFHDLLCKLLLAARLQEGLRQSICENADCGTKEGFFAILHTISENNLIRYSSVKRAVGVWMGLLTEETRDLERVSAKSVSLMLECLEDPAKRDEHLASEDAMKIYTALWSCGFENVESSAEKIYKISKNGTRHQLLVAGYYANNIDNVALENKIAKNVIKYHKDEDDILAVWLPSYMRDHSWVLYNSLNHQIKPDSKLYFENCDEIEEQYEIISEIYSSFKGKEKIFSPCVFPWYAAKISKAQIAEARCGIAAFSGDADKIDECAPLIKECSADNRRRYYAALLNDPKSEKQRIALIDGLADKETGTRMQAASMIRKIALRDDEYEKIESFLRFKAADLRKCAIELIVGRNDEDLKVSLSRLLASDKEDVRLGGLDILTELKSDEKRKSIYEAFIPRIKELSERDKIGSKEKILIDSLLPKETATTRESLFTDADRYMPNNFDEAYVSECIKEFAELFPDSSLPEQYAGKKIGLFKNLAGSCKTAKEAEADIKSLSDFIDAHREFEYTDGTGVARILGNRDAYFAYGTQMNEALARLFAEWITANSVTNSRIVRAYIRINAYNKSYEFSEACAGYVRTVFGAGFEKGIALPYDHHIFTVLHWLCSKLPEDKFRMIGAALAAWFIKCVPEDETIIESRSNLYGRRLNDYSPFLAHCQLALVYRWLYNGFGEDHAKIFPLMVSSGEKMMTAKKKALLEAENRDKECAVYYRGERIRGDRKIMSPVPCYGWFPTPLVGIRHYIIAAYLMVINERQLLEFLMRSDNISAAASMVSGVKAYLHDKDRKISSRSIYINMHCKQRVYELLGIKKGEPSEKQISLLMFTEKIYDVMIPEMLEHELVRGDRTSEYSDGIRSIMRIYGCNYFARILDALGDDTLDRSSYGGAAERRSSLSHLLAACVPEDGETAEDLRTALEGKNVSEKRLIEGALYSPEWIELVGKYLGIEGFESVCYYFIAHMNEQFDDKRKAVIARYTPLSAEELNMGAFDVDWFRSAHGSVGDKVFDMIYDAAKYISDGAKHARARKYADAALGRVTPDEVATAVSDKRNKDLLMSYSLIPLQGEDDICERYAFIQKFRKESKKFGSQRVQSEGKACEIALKNLATNAGYSDTVRLTLRMETKMVDDNRELFEEQIIDGISLKLEIDEGGKAKIAVKKDGKELKSVPAKLKKYESVVKLGAFAKTLTEQYRRTRGMLEEAMENSTAFSFSELCSLSAHPVVYPMLKNLVLCSEGEFGFISEAGLVNSQGEVRELLPESTLRVAHPYDMYNAGVWRDYQKYLFDNRIAQPFRQVFRELYVKTDEERGMLHSLRYAGNQIMPAKTVACLKSRQWVADIEAGLQKVYYKENIVAQIFAQADWFSPSDIEAPTLEWVCFSDRLTGRDLKIEEVPDIIFSEVMRDVDLAVSVAHAGGVDPETSHSTMEMRAAILSFVLPMFRIANVRVEKSHALIDGKLADYSVHLGSGVVHQMGGAMIPVLPVHSQHRGKIFLPFVDDDPKTAEIISKVVLFAEDEKIKDPMILTNISKR